MISSPEQWRRLNPLLDELLDMDQEARLVRLASWHASEPTTAAELESLLKGMAGAARSSFLEGRADSGLVSAAVNATLVGKRIGAYVLEESLGQGGTGVVWRAARADGRFAQAVAVKLLHLSLVGQQAAVRFQQEGAILARLAHPHIARMLDAGVTAGSQPYLVLELVEGERIDRHCKQRRLDVSRRVSLFREVLSAVAHAHRHLVVHRDIKPSNVMVSAEGGVKLLDFGIAKLLQENPPGSAPLTREGTRALTPDYAAPEQVRGDDVTTATDVYSLGVLLFHLLAGQHPTGSASTTPSDLMRATLDDQPMRLTGFAAGTPEVIDRIAAERDTSPARLRRQLAGDLENIVAKALRKPPAERYPTVDAFSEDLRRWEAGEPVAARADSVAYRVRRFVGRHRGAVAAVSLAFTAILAGLVGTVSQARRAEAQSERASREAATAVQERDAARQQQALQNGTSEFFALVLRDGTGGDPGAIRKQLDRSVQLIALNHFEPPIVKISLLRMLASRYAELGDHKTAVGLNRQAIAAIAGTELAAPTSAVPVNLACSLAIRLVDLGDPQGALAELDRADRLLSAGAQVSAQSRASCLEQRGNALSTLGRYAAGVQAVRQALALLASAGIREGEQLRVLRSGLSRALASVGELREAVAIARQVEIESEATQGPGSVATLNRSAIVTTMTRLGGDPLAALARSDADRAMSARLNGVDSVDDDLELERGRILLQLGRDEAAVAAFSRSARAATLSDSDPVALVAGLGEVEALVRLKKSAAAARRFQALDRLRAKATAPQRIEILRVDAVLALGQGKVDAARAALEEAGQLVASMDASPPPEAFAIDLQRVEMDLAQGSVGPDDSAVVARMLASARGSALDANRSSDVGRAMLLRARLAARNERMDEARADAQTAQASLVPTLGRDSPAAMAAAALSRIE